MADILHHPTSALRSPGRVADALLTPSLKPQGVGASADASATLGKMHPPAAAGRGAGASDEDYGLATLDTAPPAFATAVDAAPITYDRPLPVDLARHLDNPGLPRASVVVDRTHPHGTPNPFTSTRYPSRSVLQQHVTFFDRNDDGIISPWDTFLGFRALGFHVLFCIMAVFIVNGSFFYATQDSWIPDPRMLIYIKNIHRAKHGSDSETYDTEGRFVPEKFEEMWSKYAKTSPHYLTARELFEMTESIRNVGDPFGWFAAKFEWGTLLLLVGERDPATGQLVVRREHLRGQFDGSLFYQIEAERTKLANAAGAAAAASTSATTARAPVAGEGAWSSATTAAADAPITPATTTTTTSSLKTRPAWGEAVTTVEE